MCVVKEGEREKPHSFVDSHRTRASNSAVFARPTEQSVTRDKGSQSSNLKSFKFFL